MATSVRPTVPATVPRRRFTVDEYYRMAEAGILHEDDHIELLDGEIIEMSPIGGRHAACVNCLAELFITRLAGRAIVGIQNPVHLSSGSEPEPDIALVRPRPDRYASGHPRPADIFLLVEVADSSLTYDRDVKLIFYAEAGIPEAWIVDLNAARILVYRAPRPDGYRQMTIVGPEEALSPIAFPDLVLAAGEILG
ncbi:MAG: Uma2 family endonuclease [Dehalococcoidia bacterium]